MSDLTELQNHLKLLESNVEFKKKVDRLFMNDDFKQVILKGYCEEEMQRQLSLAVCEKLSPETRELCNQLAKASAALKNYLEYIMMVGRTSEEDIPNVQEEILNLQKEEE